MHNIIVSPSGQLYGSENVLFDFLKGSHKKYSIYVPDGSVFHRKLRENSFEAIGFKNLSLLYLQLFFQMLFQRKNLILNEAGHIRYIKLLAKLLPFRNFVVIIRLLEDCNAHLNNLPKNIELIAVSNFIKDKVVSNRPIHVIYDPFVISQFSSSNTKEREGNISVGVIGRVYQSKGLDYFIDLIKYFNPDQRKMYKFMFYGNYDIKNPWLKNFKATLDELPSVNYELKGFVNDQETLFNSIDVILHFNENEALGRILFEAINYNKPFLCFSQGGAGELAYNLGLKSFTFSDVSEIPDKLDALKIAKSKILIANAKNKIKENYSSENYAHQIENFL
ncbi:glycosyltransferase [Phaeodactylibacter xiamenensis]|uniref:glycosyltransferase n=1 Tax=Phaeodactylibacter xiamenensis TaxID=1524460 RepID=UPI0024A9CA1A|nr:glycosyltransferase [Phaeodactylibacter xiamenensis]